MKVFLDANILFSSSLEGSILHGFLSGIQTKVSFYSNEHALIEAQRNLKIKFPNRMHLLHQFTKQIEFVNSKSLSQAEMSKIQELIRDKDVPILLGAYSASCSHLLTGDKRDFGRYFGERILGVKIVSPELLAKELRWKP